MYQVSRDLVDSGGQNSKICQEKDEIPYFWMAGLPLKAAFMEKVVTKTPIQLITLCTFCHAASPVFFRVLQVGD